jgi:CDP-6-deoxy-D-xylo-4-hexulose-3-dehydrase
MARNPLTAKKKFEPGADWVWYAPNTRDAFGKEEITAVTKTLQDGWLTVGPATQEFEGRIGGLFGKRHALFVNSGSSANLLAFEVLDLPAGSEVITPACNFNTTVAPIVQRGLIPVFVDVKPGFYTLDVSEVEKAITKKTRAIIAPHLIGNLIDLPALRAIAKRHKLPLIEDSCDTIGSQWAGKPTGKFADITTTSFYASHLITTAGAGGMVMFDDPKLRERARVFRDWGRGISKHDDKIRSRLSTFSIDGKPYDSAFVFVEQGYNMRPTEVQAAFGLSQLNRLDTFTAVRKDIFQKLHTFFAGYPEHFILPTSEPKADVHWLAFPLTIREDSPLERNTLVRYLEDHKIQTRPLFSGNIMRHPAYAKVGRAVGALPASDLILTNAFLIGAHHGITAPMLEYVYEIFDMYLRRNT